jgi:hypothetical protein
MALAHMETMLMSGPFPSGLPPRGSTDWGVRQFLRVLNEEERQRLLAMTRGGADTGAFGQGYADVPHSPDQDEQLLQFVFANPSPGGLKPIILPAPFGPPKLVPAPVPVPAPQVKEPAPPRLPADPPIKPSAEATQRFIARGYTGEHGEGRGLPDGYVPWYGGLSEEVAERQALRADTYQWNQEQESWNREKALGLISEDEEDNRSFLESAWDALASPLSADLPTERPPVPAARMADERILVQRIVEAFSDAGIFLWESPETKQDNMDIVRWVQEAVRECGAGSKHVAGAGRPEHIYFKIPGNLRGSRRPDGSIEIHHPDGSVSLYEFNTVDVYADGSFTSREMSATADIIELQKERRPKIRAYMDMFGKSIKTRESRHEWRKRVRPLVKKAVRSILKC